MLENWEDSHDSHPFSPDDLLHNHGLYFSLHVCLVSFLCFCFFVFYKFIYLFLAALGLRCCARAFSSCGKRGLLFVAVSGLLTAAASLVAELQAPGAQASVVVAHELSCSAACGIFLDQGSKPCPLHWQGDS